MSDETTITNPDAEGFFLTPSEQAFCDEIKATEPMEAHVKQAKRFIEGIPYTATALLAMAAFVAREFDDAEGARKLAALADWYAEHEAKTV